MPIGQTAMPPDVNKLCFTHCILQEKGMPAYLMARTEGMTSNGMLPAKTLIKPLHL